MNQENFLIFSHLQTNAVEANHSLTFFTFILHRDTGAQIIILFNFEHLM